MKAVSYICVGWPRWTLFRSHLSAKLGLLVWFAQLGREVAGGILLVGDMLRAADESYKFETALSSSVQDKNYRIVSRTSDVSRF